MTCWLIIEWVAYRKMAQPPSTQLTPRKGNRPMGRLVPGGEGVPPLSYSAVCSVSCQPGGLPGGRDV